MSSRILCQFTRRLYCSSIPVQDPISSAFFKPQVQKTLISLTGLNYGKIFRVARRGQKVTAPTYSFMTEKELEAAKATTKAKALKKLQMPPVMSARSENVTIIDEDPAIRGILK
jgi:hypothetical protein